MDHLQPIFISGILSGPTATHDFNIFPFLGHQIVASQAAEVTHFGVQLAIHRVAIGDLCMTPPESDKNELTQTRVVEGFIWFHRA